MEINDNEKKWFNSFYLFSCNCCFSFNCCIDEKPENNKEEHKCRYSNNSKIEIDNDTFSDDEIETSLDSSLKYLKSFNPTNKVYQQKFINIYSYDFEGYLFGDKANEFLKFIIENKDNIKVFDIKYI